MTRSANDYRQRQIAMGAAVLLGLGLLLCGALLGWRYLPGLLGEWLGTIIGVMTTPVFLEISCAVIGLTMVLAINYWRQRRAGDDFVYLEQVEPQDAKNDMPGHANWAVYREPPLEGVTPTLQELAEGAMEIGDVEMAADWLAAMSEEELKRPEALVLRLALAKASGRLELIDPLEKELHAARHSRSSQARESDLEKFAG